MGSQKRIKTMSELTIRQIQDRKRQTEKQIAALVMKFQEETAQTAYCLDIHVHTWRQMKGFTMNEVTVTMELSLASFLERDIEIYDRA